MGLLKQNVKKLAEVIIHSDFFRETVWQALKDLMKPTQAAQVAYVASPYKTGSNSGESDIPAQKAPVFITGRFRSGSTFLWLLFRHLQGVRSFYEPLNENQWFRTHAHAVDPSHIGVKDYAREYETVHGLSDLYDERWTFRDLYMSGRDHDAAFYRYIRKLVTAGPERSVLQFNRVDFRLAWLKANFPDAFILHLYRHPREQWMSVQRDGGPISLDYRYRTGEYLNLFYLLVWAKDLRRLFPFLEPEGRHPYTIHYYLWRLSHFYGTAYADMSLSYESLVTDFTSVFPSVLEKMQIPVRDEEISRLAELNTGSVKETWKTYAGTDWFDAIESECDRVLEVFFKDKAS